MALLETLRAENEAMGRAVNIVGSVATPFYGVLQLLKWCMSNLIDNAVLYGKQAEVHVAETATELTLRIRDHGPGMPARELECVFEPFIAWKPPAAGKPAEPGSA